MCPLIQTIFYNGKFHSNTSAIPVIFYLTLVLLILHDVFGALLSWLLLTLTGQPFQGNPTKTVQNSTYQTSIRKCCLVRAFATFFQSKKVANVIDRNLVVSDHTPKDILKHWDKYCEAEKEKRNFNAPVLGYVTPVGGISV